MSDILFVNPMRYSSFVRATADEWCLIISTAYFWDFVHDNNRQCLGSSLPSMQQSDLMRVLTTRRSITTVFSMKVLISNFRDFTAMTDCIVLCVGKITQNKTLFGSGTE